MIRTITLALLIKKNRSDHRPEEFTSFGHYLAISIGLLVLPFFRSGLTLIPVNTNSPGNRR